MADEQLDRLDAWLLLLKSVETRAKVIQTELTGREPTQETK